MDVGFYLGELLMQQGEVSVPGLGYFVQARMSGYYDENDAKFYPPYHKAQFDVQSIDDDALAEYIAVKKNISIASAKYFSEKYITSLKQEALLGEVPIGNLGWFYTELTQLTFRPADKIINDTIFYGFEPVKINKGGRIDPVIERPKVELNYPPRFTQQPAATEEEQQPAFEPAPVQQTTRTMPEEDQIGIEQDFIEEEDESKSPLRALLIVLALVVTLGVGIFAVYRYKPEIFKKLIFWKHNTAVSVAVKPKAIVKPKADTVETDTLRTDTVAAKKPDTVAKTVKTETKIEKAPVKPTVISAQPAATVTKPVTNSAKPAASTTKTVATTTRTPMPDLSGILHYEVIAATCKDTVTAEKAIKKLKTRGLDGKIVAASPGSVKVSVGAYKTYVEAEDAAIKLANSGKVTTDVYPIEIKPKQ